MSIRYHDRNVAVQMLWSVEIDGNIVKYTTSQTEMEAWYAGGATVRKVAYLLRNEQRENNVFAGDYSQDKLESGISLFADSAGSAFSRAARPDAAYVARGSKTAFPGVKEIIVPAATQGSGSGSRQVGADTVSLGYGWPIDVASEQETVEFSVVGAAMTQTIRYSLAGGGCLSWWNISRGAPAWNVQVMNVKGYTTAQRCQMQWWDDEDPQSTHHANEMGGVMAGKFSYATWHPLSDGYTPAGPLAAIHPLASHSPVLISHETFDPVLGGKVLLTKSLGVEYQSDGLLPTATSHVAVSAGWKGGLTGEDAEYDELVLMPWLRWVKETWFNYMGIEGLVRTRVWIEVDDFVFDGFGADIESPPVGLLPTLWLRGDQSGLFDELYAYDVPTSVRSRVRDFVGIWPTAAPIRTYRFDSSLTEWVDNEVYASTLPSGAGGIYFASAAAGSVGLCIGASNILQPLSTLTPCVHKLQASVLWDAAINPAIDDEGKVELAHLWSPQSRKLLGLAGTPTPYLDKNQTNGPWVAFTVLGTQAEVESLMDTCAVPSFARNVEPR